MGKPPKQSLEEYAEQKAKERFTENAEIARSNRALHSANAELRRDLIDLTKRLGLYERLAEERLDPPTWLAPPKKDKAHVAIPCMLLGDIHWGEVVRPIEIDGLNCYNVRIAGQRVKRSFEGAIKLSRDYLAGVSYEGFTLFLTGDIVSGIIHEELRETNQETVVESILGVVEQLEAGINLLASTFGRVHVAAVVGNHGRLTRKPRAKRRAAESLDWLIYKMLERDCRSKGDVTVQVADAADASVDVYSHRYVLTHGDQFVGGTGISGALAPLLLGVHRKMRKEAAAGRPFDTLLMGHWHQSYFLKGLIVGGSVIGYNEYAAMKNLLPEAPQCAFWLNTPEHGPSIRADVYPEDRKAEGW